MTNKKITKFALLKEKIRSKSFSPLWRLRGALKTKIMKTIKTITMKKLLLSAALFAASISTFAQVGVGTTTPKGALHVDSSTSGVIIPQFADLTAIQAIKKADGTTALNTDEQGMQVYNIAEKKIYMWDGTAWVAANASGLWENNSADNLVELSTLSDGSTPRSGSNLVLISDEGQLLLGKKLSDITHPSLFSSITGNKILMQSPTDANTGLTLLSNGGISLSKEEGFVGTNILSYSNFPNTASYFTTYRARGDYNTPSTVVTNDILGEFGSQGYSGLSSNGFTNAGRIRFRAESHWSTSVDSYLQFLLTSNNVSSEKMRITSQGNLGIGTSTPGAKLSVVGLIEYADNTAATTAGLTAGDFYRTADGTVKVVF